MTLTQTNCWQVRLAPKMKQRANRLPTLINANRISGDEPRLTVRIPWGPVPSAVRKSANQAAPADGGSGGCFDFAARRPAAAEARRSPIMRAERAKMQAQRAKDNSAQGKAAEAAALGSGPKMKPSLFSYPVWRASGAPNRIGKKERLVGVVFHPGRRPRDHQSKDLPTSRLRRP
jgi:hypothetical protein